MTFYRPWNGSPDYMTGQARTAPGCPVLTRRLTGPDLPCNPHAAEQQKRLDVLRAGSGAPAVILVAGLGNALDTWAQILPAAAEFSTVVAYSRSGLGRSEPGLRDHTAKSAAVELHALLTKLQLKPPYVLVGRSYGGILVRLGLFREVEELLVNHRERFDGDVGEFERGERQVEERLAPSGDLDGPPQARAPGCTGDVVEGERARCKRCYPTLVNGNRLRGRMIGEIFMRKRYQKGSLEKLNGIWIARWYEGGHRRARTLGRVSWPRGQTKW